MNIENRGIIFNILKYLLYSFSRILSDKKFLQLKFWLFMGYPLDLEHPRTFNEKLQWLKLYDRKPEYIRMVDKIEAKEYVANIIGEKYIIPTLGVYDKPEDIDFDVLPEQFVLKTTHDSGGVYICRDIFNKAEVIKKLRKRLKRNVFWYNREWPYKNVKPKILAEKYLTDDGIGLKDYKFMCYNGECRNMLVCSGRAQHDLRIDIFDTQWNHLPFKRNYPNANYKIPKPDNLQEMISLSEKIAKQVSSPFLRVDFYSISNKVYFGELTFYPGSGMVWIRPEEWDEKMGKWLELPNNI